MNKYLKQAIFFIIAVFALFCIVGGATNAGAVLPQISPVFFIVGAVFFIASVFIWLISWGYLIKKRYPIPYPELLKIGFAALYGALTPIQLGAEALRSVRLKDRFGVSYTDSISASMVCKGMKFLIITITALLALFAFIFVVKLEGILLLSFFSGLVVVVLAVLLFLLPLHGFFGEKIASFFFLIGKKFKLSNKLAEFFKNYSSYIRKLTKKSIAIVFVLCLVSFLFEFLALQFSFFSLGISLNLAPLFVLMVLVSVLERTPFLPRGIGVVELVGYYFLAMPQLLVGEVLSTPQIGAVLIVYDVIRLIIPTIVSFFFNFALLKK